MLGRKLARNWKTYLALIGQITHDWNVLERALCQLIAAYVGDDELSHVFTGGMRNADRARVLEQLVELYEPSPKLQAKIAFLIKAFSILGENRNVLVHSESAISAGKRTLWYRPHKRDVDQILFSSAGLKELRSLLVDIDRLTNLAFALAGIVTLREHGEYEGKAVPSPRIFRLPRKIEQLLPEDLPHALGPPQSSRA
jgi:hypothetical protein